VESWATASASAAGHKRPSGQLEDACLKRFGALPHGDTGVTVRSDNGLVFTSRLYRKLLASYGRQQLQRQRGRARPEIARYVAKTGIPRLYDAV
jgi:hypothetical protein